MKTKYIGFATPKTLQKIHLGEIETPEEYSDIEWVFDNLIYMNLLEPEWTEEMVDNTVYIIKRSYLEGQKKIGFGNGPEFYTMSIDSSLISNYSVIPRYNLLFTCKK